MLHGTLHFNSAARIMLLLLVGIIVITTNNTNFLNYILTTQILVVDLSIVSFLYH